MPLSWKKCQSPGQALKDFLDESEWTQEDLSFILSVSPKHINELVNDKKSLSIELALSLEHVFEWSAKDWMNLQTKYQLTDASDTEKTSLVKFRAEISKKMPLNELVKKGWLNKFENKSQLERQLKSFWGLPLEDEFSLSILDSRIRALKFKRSDKYKSSFEATHAVTWAQMVENFAKKVAVADYSSSGLENLMSDLHNYTKANNGVKKFISDLAGVGVKFVFLSHLSKTYLDGAAFRVGEHPVVALTGRYDRVDNFWFTLAHELSHVLYHLSESKKESIFIDDSTNYGDSKEEIEANKSAESILLLEEVLEFLKDHLNYLTVDKLLDCSNQLRLHASIIAGMLAHRDLIAFSNLHRFKEPIRDQIPKKYKVEG